MKRLLCLAALAMVLGLGERAYSQDEKITGSGTIAMAASNSYPLSGTKREFSVEVGGSTDAAPVRGRVEVEGSDNFSGGQMGEAKWVLHEGTVTGRLVRNGYVVGSFAGTMASGGAASGVFMMSDGTPVKWTWTPDAAQAESATPSSEPFAP